MTTKATDRTDPLPLRLRHPLRNREVATGFASRLAAVNGRSLSELLRHRNIPPWDVDRGEPGAIRYLAAIGSADPDLLLHQAVRPTSRDRRWQVAGEAFGPDVINRTFFRYCPQCVLEDLHDEYGPLAARPWQRIEWTLYHYRACHRHHRFLVAAKGTQRRFHPIDFNETMRSLFPEMQKTAVVSAPFVASPYHEWIVARVEGSRDPQSWLDTLPLHVGAAWCENLGISARHKVRPRKLTDLDRAEACEQGFRIASGGEEAIREFLTGLNRAERRSTGSIGPREIYGYAYRLLMHTKDDPAFDSLRCLVRDFAMTSMPWEPGTDILGVTVQKRVLATVRSAALEAGANTSTMRNIFKRSGWAVEDIERGTRNGRVMAPARDVGILVKKLKGSLNFPETMRLLGIERKQLLGMVKAGALPYAFGTEREFGGHGRFALEDIEAMMSRLLDGAVTVEKPNDGQVSINAARMMARATTVEVFRLILSGRLEWKGCLYGHADLNSILLDASEVVQLLRSDAPQLRNLRKIDVSHVVLGLNKNSVEPLIRLGQLTVSEEISPTARRVIPVITRTSAEVFHRKYVTALELGQAQGLHPKRVKKLLGCAGIDVAFKQQAVHGIIYDRAAVQRVTSGQPGFWRETK